MRALKLILFCLMLAIAFGHGQELSHFLGIDESKSSVPITEVKCCGFKQIPSLGFEGEWQGYIPETPDPKFISQEGISWMKPREPVVALELNGEARAYPLQILVHHEVINDVLGGVPVAITLCPICNSAIAFDRRIPLTQESLGELSTLNPVAPLNNVETTFLESYAFQQGRKFPFVKTVLADFHTAAGYNGNLMVMDSQTSTLWSQILGKALVGTLSETQLLLYPAQIIGFSEFRELYPGALVLSKDTGFDRSYGYNPFLGFDDIDNPPLSQPDLEDGRLSAKARIANVFFRGESVAYPFATLANVNVINDHVADLPVAVFWQEGTANSYGKFFTQEGKEVGATAVFSRVLDEQVLRFSWTGLSFIDEQTGSEWNLAGKAISGELEGKQLQAIVHDNTLWYSWVRFHPDTRVYTANLSCTMTSGSYAPAEKIPLTSSHINLSGGESIKLAITGTVYASDCTTPLSEAMIEIWHADRDGKYGNYQGVVFSNDEGQFSFSTIMPAHYKIEEHTRAAHIHLRINHSKGRPIETEILFEDDPYLETDTEVIKENIIALKQNSKGVFEGEFDIILAPSVF